MKNLRIILVLSTALILAHPMNAQEKKPSDWAAKRERMRQEFEAKKIAFFTTELDLTPQEARDFWPLYNELWAKRQNTRKELSRTMYALLDEMRKEQPDKKKVKSLSEKYLEYMPDDMQLMIDYTEQFKKIMPVEKVALVYHVEEKFRNTLLRELREK